MTELEVKSGARGSKSPGARLVSALELLLGTFIVIGHNVFHVVPNEVPILAALGLISFRVRGGGWSALPFRRPDSWKRLVLIALAAAASRILRTSSRAGTSGRASSPMASSIRSG